MYIYMYIHIDINVYIYIYKCACICIHRCINVYICIQKNKDIVSFVATCTFWRAAALCIAMLPSLFIFVCVYIYVCVYMYIYMCIYV